MKPLADVLDALLTAHREGSRLVLLFDYDGTLTPIVDHPSAARLPRATRRLLERLSLRPRVVVGIVSARTLNDLKQMCCLTGVGFAGNCGLEVELDGVRRAHPQARAAAAIVAGFKDALERIAAAFPGAWVQDKRLSVTFHYRNVPPDRQQDLREAIEESLGPWSDRLRITEAPLALEIVPELDWGKGDIVRWIVEQAGGEAPAAIYAGDSANDEDAFEEVIWQGGFAIGIGPSAPEIAPHRLPNPASLAEFLDHLDRALDRGKDRWRKRAAEETLALYGLWKPTLPAISPGP